MNFSITQDVDDAIRNQGPAATDAVQQARTLRDQMRDFLADTADLDEPTSRTVTALLNSRSKQIWNGTSPDGRTG